METNQTSSARRLVTAGITRAVRRNPNLTKVNNEIQAAQRLDLRNKRRLLAQKRT